jgi:hypothetical protein
LVANAVDWAIRRATPSTSTDRVVAVMSSADTKVAYPALAGLTMLAYAVALRRPRGKRD